MNDDDLLGRWADRTNPGIDPITADEVRLRADTALAPLDELRPSRRSRSLTLLAAAAVLVVAAIAGALAFADRGDDTDQVQSRDALAGSGGGPSVEGRTWTLTSLSLNRGSLDVPGAGTETGPILDLTRPGQIQFTGCNTGSGAGRLRDGVLQVDQWAVEEKACTGTDGEALMELDQVMGQSLVEGVTVELDGPTLTLTQMAMTATFVDLDAPAEPSTEGMGTVRVRLEPIEGPFIEGFEVGLRFETADGTVIASTLWTDFVESTGRADLDAYYDSVLEQPVPAGSITIRAEVAIGPAGPPTPPDLEGDLPCSVTVDLQPDDEADVEVRFDEQDGRCLRLLGPDEAGTTTTSIAGEPTTTMPNDPATTTVQPEVGIGIGYYVDVDLQCEAFELDGTWVLVEGDLSSWQPAGERHEGGTFTMDSPTTGTFLGDAEGTKRATFRLLGPDESPACEPIPR